MQAGRTREGSLAIYFSAPQAGPHLALEEGFEPGAKPFDGQEGKKNFHVRATKNVSAYLINYFLKCLFHFGSWKFEKCLEYYNYHFWEKNTHCSIFVFAAGQVVVQDGK